MSKPANILNFETPTGAVGNLLNPSSWWRLVLGTCVLLVVWNVGQGIVARVKALPALSQLTGAVSPAKPNNVSAFPIAGGDR